MSNMPRAKDQIINLEMEKLTECVRQNECLYDTSIP
jgi:hypothetical protein